MLVNTKGIILHQTKYSESSLIVKVYTEKFGLQSYLLNSVRKKKPQIKPALLQNLSIIDLVVYHNKKQTLQRVKEISPAYKFVNIPFDIRKSSIALFMGELIYKSIKEEEPNLELFDFIFNAIKELDVASEKFSNVHLIFAIHLTKHLGFFPRGKYSVTKPFFDLREGVFEHHLSGHQEFILHPESQYLSEISNTSFEDFKKLYLPSNHRKKLLSDILHYYKLHLPGFREINSHKILEEVFV